MTSFEWLEPTSIAEVFVAKKQFGDEARLIAGGTWVTLVLNQGLLYPSALISLRRVPNLDSIRHDPASGLTIGAMVTHRTVETHPLIRQRYPMLAETFGVVANVRIRNQATAGGCICDADYASDPPTMLVALGAEVSLQRVSAPHQRRVAVEDFITGHYETVIRPDELLTEIQVPPLPAGGRGVYLKYRTRSHEDRPCVGVAVVLATTNGTISHLRVVVGAVAAKPQRIAEAEKLALGKPMTETLAKQIGEAYSDAIDPLDDLRGSSWYRKQMIRVLVKRAILQAGERSPAV
jgi:aerobic carbon-monoxide dehydrogenase medium subunit